MAIAVNVTGATVPQRTIALAAWGAFLHPGRDATLPEIESYLRAEFLKVVRDYQYEQSVAAVPEPAPLDP